MISTAISAFSSVQVLQLQLDAANSKITEQLQELQDAKGKIQFMEADRAKHLKMVTSSSMKTGEAMGELRVLRALFKQDKGIDLSTCLYHNDTIQNRDLSFSPSQTQPRSQSPM